MGWYAELVGVWSQSRDASALAVRRVEAERKGKKDGKEAKQHFLLPGSRLVSLPAELCRCRPVMAPSPLFSISLLAAGAAVGAGTAAFLSSRPRREAVPVPESKPSAPPLPSQQAPLPSSSSNTFETDLVDRRLLALAARQAGGAIESSGYPGQ